ncbi:50S ribosomal protein L15 [Pseudomonas taiwanensis SJ9]|uniref:50S ribosomal protein L15 n=1 Tax=Pseudomonas taiwanensis SJ9 TaxID=1388762 RepID=V7D6M7_9PSED|nr:50S ribosomal protein L15 [Pseudomonas taiwanensis SJ9]
MPRYERAQSLRSPCFVIDFPSEVWSSLEDRRILSCEFALHNRQLCKGIVHFCPARR